MATVVKVLLSCVMLLVLLETTGPSLQASARSDNDNNKLSDYRQFPKGNLTSFLSQPANDIL